MEQDGDDKVANLLQMTEALVQVTGREPLEKARRQAQEPVGDRGMQDDRTAPRQTRYR